MTKHLREGADVGVKAFAQPTTPPSDFWLYGREILDNRNAEWQRSFVAGWERARVTVARYWEHVFDVVRPTWRDDGWTVEPHPNTPNVPGETNRNAIVICGVVFRIAPDGIQPAEAVPYAWEAFEIYHHATNRLWVEGDRRSWVDDDGLRPKSDEQARKNFELLHATYQRRGDFRKPTGPTGSADPVARAIEGLDETLNMWLSRLVDVAHRF